MAEGCFAFAIIVADLCSVFHQGLDGCRFSAADGEVEGCFVCSFWTAKRTAGQWARRSRFSIKVGSTFEKKVDCFCGTRFRGVM